MSASDSLSPQQFMYHVAQDRNRGSIESGGLSLGHNTAGTLHSTLAGAQAHASTQGSHYADGTMSKPDVYRVDVGGYRARKTPGMAGAGQSRYSVNQIVPSGRITRMI